MFDQIQTLNSLDVRMMFLDQNSQQSQSKHTLGSRAKSKIHLSGASVQVKKSPKGLAKWKIQRLLNASLE